MGRGVSLINTTFLKTNIFSGNTELLGCRVDAALPVNAEPAARDRAASDLTCGG